MKRFFMKTPLYFSTSFSALSTEDQRKVSEFLESGDVHHLDLRRFYLKRNVFSSVIREDMTLLSHFDAISPAFSTLTESQKETIEKDLMLIFYRLFTQYELDRIESMSHKLSETAEQIRRCAALINHLRLTRIEPKVSQSLLRETANSGQCTRYLGVKLLVPALLESIDTIASGHQKATDFIGFINERRLYWIWASSSVSILLTAFPNEFGNATYANQTLTYTGLIGGNLSWILYFMRASFGWYGLIRHTFFLSEEEAKLNFTWNERFWIQWEMRKYQILNDTIWGICNFACFFVLVGSGLLGDIGNGLTASLLLMDGILALMRLYEEESAYRLRQKCFEEELRQLESKMRWSVGGKVSVDDKMAYETLKWKMTQARLEWDHRVYQASLDLLYSTFLFIAFVVLIGSALMMPHVALILAVAATITCFTLNLSYNTGTMTLGVAKSKKMIHESDALLLEKIEAFKVLAAQFEKTQDPNCRKTSEGQLKMYYLEMKLLKSESIYQQKMCVYQRNRLLVSTIRDLVIPVLFITSLVFLPWGVGVPLLILSLGLAFALYSFFEKTVPQKDGHLADFPEKEYDLFVKKALLSSTDQLACMLNQDRNIGDSGIQTEYVYN